jgi:hypothetical protein
MTAVQLDARPTGAPSHLGHALFGVLFVLGVVLRVTATTASGAAFGRGFAPASVAALLSAALLYLLMLRWGVWRWLAALVTLPALLDPRLVMLEHLAPAPIWLALLATAALLAACWRVRAPLAAQLLAGLCLAAALLLLVFGAGSSPAPDTVQAIRQPLVGALHDYSRIVRTPGTLLVVAFLLCLMAVLGLGRARGSGLRVVCALAGLLPFAVVVATVAGVSAGGTDALAALVWCPPAGALGLTALLRGRRAASAGLPQVDGVDRAAQQSFSERYGDPRLAPAVVVIAAYNEGDGLPDVLASMPETVCGLPLDVLVVDDGSTDVTASSVRRDARAYLVSCPVNRGQGAALRLGYRVAREHGAQYLLTTDADGQYDTADFPAVLAPVLDARADFVTGSRRLGHQHTHDRVRRLGVHVFAWLVSALVGLRLTDTSFGLRAMRAAVTGVVTLNQPQYQSSELLIGVVSHGFRVLEVPGTMHLRSAGSTKKGRNLVYGTRYAKVVLGTWWREGCPSPVADHAPALADCSR